MREDLDAIAEAQANGYYLVGAVSCCPLSMDFTLQSPYVFEGLDAWKPALALKGDLFKTKLGEKAFRNSLREEIARPAHFRLFNGEWDKVHVIEARNKEGPSWRPQVIRIGGNGLAGVESCVETLA